MINYPEDEEIIQKMTNCPKDEEIIQKVINCPKDEEIRKMINYPKEIVCKLTQLISILVPKRNQ